MISPTLPAYSHMQYTQMQDLLLLYILRYGRLWRVLCVGLEERSRRVYNFVYTCPVHQRALED
jgi:hypothetical protein